MKQTIIATTDPECVARMCAAIARGESVVLTASTSISAAAVAAVGHDVIEAQIRRSCVVSLARSIEMPNASPPVGKRAPKAARPRWRP